MPKCCHEALKRFYLHLEERSEHDCIEDIGGKATRKRPLGRPRCRWEDNVKIDLRGE
jgi:hypothetical protein